MHITAIKKYTDHEFRAEYESISGTGYMNVYAKDELDAFMRAEHLIKEEDMSVRYITVGLTLCVLALFSLIAYGCSQPSFKEVCIQSGKTYLATLYDDKSTNIEMCK